MTRIPALDMMKGVAILFMIVGHCQIPDNLHHIIYLFHIPLFFMVSGYFYHRKEIMPYMLADFRRLIIPYFFCTLTVLLKFSIDGFRLHDFSRIPDFLVSILWGSGPWKIGAFSLSDIGPVWFLLAMFWCRQIFNVFMTRFSYGIVVACAVALFGILLNQFICLPWSFLQGMAGILFYAMGYLFSKISGVGSAPWVVLSIVIIPMVFAYGEMDMHSGSYPMLFFNVAGACAATYLVYVLLKALSRMNGFASVLGWMGRWSLLILGVHYVEFMLFNWNIHFSKWIGIGTFPDLKMVFLRLVCIITVTAILSRFTFIKQLFCGTRKTT